jgi:hypothetical protein
MKGAMRRRLVVLGLLLLAALALTAVAGSEAKPKPLRVQVSFTGSATGRFQDVERWIFLEENECYLRRTRDQQVQITWSASWSGTVGKALRAAAAAGQGVVSGSEIRDTCDEEELPPDAPEDWLRSVTCSDPLTASGALAAAWSGTAARPVLTLAGPPFSLAQESICTALPRSTELTARIALARKTLERLAPGKSISIPLGSALTRYGNYTPQANCKHEAKPYEGYRSLDECQDAFIWSGQVRILRIR